MEAAVEPTVMHEPQSMQVGKLEAEHMQGILAAPMDVTSNSMELSLPSPGRDSDRFYCPYPGCNRSFAELWRLKVHYRAPPDVRGSGKERGHGTELSHCPKCNKALKPGKHHVGCSAARGTPRQAKRKGESDGKMEVLGKVRRSGDITPSSAQMHGSIGQPPQPPWPPGAVDASYYGQSTMPSFPYWQHAAYPGAHHPVGAAPAPYPFAYGYPAQPGLPPAVGHSSNQFQDPNIKHEPATGIPVMGYPAGSIPHGIPGPIPPHPEMAAMPGMPLPGAHLQSMTAAMPAHTQHGVAPGTQLQHRQQQQQQHQPQQQQPSMLQGGHQMANGNKRTGSATPSLSGIESSEPEFLASIFNEDDEPNETEPGAHRVVPSPPPLPDDFHAGAVVPNRLLFNFSQFNQRMPHSLHETHATRELTDKEAHDLAEQHVVYDHTDDGELMQMLFGMADDMPTMATIHLHTWHNLDDDEAHPPPLSAAPPSLASSNGGVKHEAGSMQQQNSSRMPSSQSEQEIQAVGDQQGTQQHQHNEMLTNGMDHSMSNAMDSSLLLPEQLQCSLSCRTAPVQSPA